MLRLLFNPAREVVGEVSLRAFPSSGIFQFCLLAAIKVVRVNWVFPGDNRRQALSIPPFPKRSEAFLLKVAARRERRRDAPPVHRERVSTQVSAAAYSTSMLLH